MKLSNKYQDLHETFNNEDYEIVDLKVVTKILFDHLADYEKIIKDLGHD